MSGLRRITLSYVIAALVVVLSVVQGGYFPLVTCVGGVTAVLFGTFASLRNGRTGGISIVTVLISALVVANLASAIVNGVTLTTLALTGFWAAVAAVSLLVSRLSEDAREKTLRTLAWLGIAMAVCAVLTSAGIISFYGSLDGRRLDFTFQYANATGVWFAACTLLCLASGDGWLRGLSALPALCLLLTESGGVVVVFALVSAVLGILWTRTERWDDLLCAIATGVVAVCAYGLSRAVTPLLGLAAACAWCLACRRLEDVRVTEGLGRELCRVLLFVFAVGTLVAGLTLRSRVASAAGNLVERVYQVRDAVSLWLTGPLLGVGPDMWQYLYPYWQSAQYVTKVVHCSYAQTLVDSGLIGLALLLTVCFVGIRDLVKHAHEVGGLAEGEAAVAALIVLHSVVDFDLRFGALSFLLALLLTVPDGSRLPVGGRAALLSCAAPCLVLCLAGGLSDMCLIAMETENLSGDYVGCVSLYERNPLAKNDPGATAECLTALVELGEDERAADLLRAIDLPTDREAVLGSISLYQLGRGLDAGELLVSQLEAQPYNYQLFITAKRVIDAYGLDDSLVSRYNASVDCANALVDAASPLLPRQRRVDTYLEVPAV